MKKFGIIILMGLVALGIVSCFGIEGQDYLTLTPITITSASDTINTDLGVELVYTGVTVESKLDVTYEWAYGTPATGSTLNEPSFSSLTVISDSPTIDYTFDKIGSYYLRLEVDNGESIEFKYFILNVNAGYDEGILILNNDSEGYGYMTFIKTLTTEEQENGEQEVYEDIFAGLVPSRTLMHCTDMYITEATLSSTDYAALAVATADGEGTIYTFEPKTMELINSASMSDFGTYCKEFSGEYASSAAYAGFFLGADGMVYRLDFQIGFVADLDVYANVTNLRRAVPVFNSSSATSSTTVSPFFFSIDSVFTRSSASAGLKSRAEEGYEVVNMSAVRVGTNSTAVYVLLRNIEDPSSCLIRRAGYNLTGTTWVEIANFTADDLKMDSDSRIVNTKSSSDVYYTYDNAIYRWGLTSLPGITPAITLPDGEKIRSIAVNYKGKSATASDEEYLYVATYNESRSTELKGSLYVYRFSDETLVKSYEAICHDPTRVLYKYRIN